MPKEKQIISGAIISEITPYTTKGIRRKSIVSRDTKTGRFLSRVVTTGNRKSDIALLKSRSDKTRRKWLREMGAEDITIEPKKPVIGKLTIYNVRINANLMIGKSKNLDMYFFFDIHIPAFEATGTPEEVSDISSKYGAMFKELAMKAVAEMHNEKPLQNNPTPDFVVESIGIEGISGESEAKETSSDLYTITTYSTETGSKYYSKSGIWNHRT